MSIGIIDYSVGNVGSVFNTLWNLGEDPKIISTPEEILESDRLVLPGVGAAGPAMAALRERSIDEAIREAALSKGAPILGICLGMQILSDTLHEYGPHEGLGLISGEVVHFDDILADAEERLPHMGWTHVELKDRPSPLHGIGGNLYFYFAHSFVFRASDESHVAATSNYGAPITVALVKDNIFATQFHPEKSQAKGEKVLENFLAWTP